MAEAPAGLAGWLMPVACLALAALLVVLGIRLVRRLRARRLSREFRTRFGMEPGRGIHLTRRRAKSQGSSYVLAFPRWARANRDGSHDDRSNDRGTHHGTCQLDLDSYTLTCTDPIMMAGLVSDLRRRGAVIEPCALERLKAERMGRTRTRRGALDSLEDICRAYADEPAGFERLCADLLRSQGHTCEVTPASNDGGYDIVCRRGDVLDMLVECKCFSQGTVVGRPLVQKLVGADQGPDGALAPHLLFMTTSRYSSQAQAYAAETGVSLIDGGQLLRMLEEQGLLGGAETEEAAAGTAADGWQLTRDDLMRHYPPDWFVGQDRP
ncbi:MAG: restriction endonuclease [Atopobiaceae bacterium]|nr:restriction endonuclease [Atopobiaceae bacterium]MCH4276022.1 restriction endonuclease [Atopobiaceae bacterium]MDD2588666.1 restriction endonuclease [Atopobiaceae bacterium]